MKKLFFILSLFISTITIAQTSNDCLDIVYLKDGSKLKGTLIEMKIGEYLLLKSVSNIEIKVESKFLKKVVQDCKDNKDNVIDNSIFDKGFHFALRGQVLPGKSYFNSFNIGFGSHVAFNYRRNHRIGYGISVGVERFTINDVEDVTTYPVMAEISGLISTKRISPSYIIGVGYGFVNQKNEYQNNNRNIIDYKGGLTYQALVGLRLSDNLRLNTGVRFQHKTKYWNNQWAWTTEDIYINKDKIVNKRLLIGIEYIW